MELVDGGKNMISMKMAQLFKNELGFKALNKISQCTKFKPSTTILLKTVLRELNEAAGKLMKDREEIIKDLADKDDSGFPKVDKGNYVLSAAAQVQAEELHKAFMAQEINLPRPKLSYENLFAAELSAEDLLALDGLID
jgi:hypothetical protein